MLRTEGPELHSYIPGSTLVIGLAHECIFTSFPEMREIYVRTTLMSCKMVMAKLCVRP